MKKTLFLLCVAAVSVFSSCDVARQAQGAYNMVNCKYEYNSIDNFSIAGMNLSNGISLLQAPQILSLLSGNVTSLPVGFNLNLDVTNPNKTEALLNGLDYILTIDDIDFTRGSVERQLSIAPGATDVLPLAMAFDVATLLKGESRDAVTGVIKNIVGLGGSQPSKVTLQIRPSFMVAGYKVTSPVYIPVGFEFGGK